MALQRGKRRNCDIPAAVTPDILQGLSSASGTPETSFALYPYAIAGNKLLLDVEPGFTRCS